MPYWRKGVRHTDYGSYLVANLPTPVSMPGLAAGDTAYASNGLKGSETTGNGTGVQVFRDATNWCRVDTGAVVGA